MSDMCEFCDKSDFSSQIVFISSEHYVLVPRKPTTPGHLMVVTKNHVQRMDEMSDGAAQDFIRVIRYIVDRLSEKEENNFVGYNTLSNNGGLDVDQHVQHFHMHLFFRFENEESSPFDILSGKLKAKDYTVSEYKELVEEYKNTLNN